MQWAGNTVVRWVRCAHHRAMRRSSRGAGVSVDVVGPALAELLRERKRVVVVTGAGLSAGSGLPVYREAADAVWETSLMKWATRDAFLKDPAAWWRGLGDRGLMRFLQADPNPGHAAIADLAQRHPSLVVVTQNVDGLHHGVPPTQLIEAHGTLTRLKCVSADCVHATSTTLAGDPAADPTHGIGVPRCPRCDGPLCPAILQFDEDYESHAVFQWHKAMKWFQEAQAFLFVGTSFAVGATNEVLLEAAKRHVPVFSFNLVVPKAIRRLERLGVSHVLGTAVETLPALAQAIAAEVPAAASSTPSPTKRARLAPPSPSESGQDAASPADLPVQNSEKNEG